jgi:hypothetical protein
LGKRSDCSFRHTESQCPAVNKPVTGSNGMTYCPGWNNFPANGCATFCQLSASFPLLVLLIATSYSTPPAATEFVRGQESPFPRSECHYPGECELSESQSTSWGYSVSITPKVGKALKIGVSGSFTQTWARSSGHSWKFAPAEGECGYFTFVPIKKITW